MKRYISLLLILPLVLAATIVPASAAESDYNIYNLLDYDYILDFTYEGENGSEPAQYIRNLIIFDQPGTYYVTFAMPFTLVEGFNFSAFVGLEDPEVITSIGGPQFSFAGTDYGSTSQSHDLFLFEGRILYCYPEGDTITIPITVSDSWPGMSMEFFSFNVIPFYNTAPTDLQIFDVIRQTVTTVPMGVSSYDYNVNVAWHESVDAADFSIRLRPLATEGTYDFFDLSFEITGLNLQSITCMQGDKPLDFDVGFAYLDASGDFIYGNNEDLLGIESNTFVRCWVSLRVYTPAANFIDGWPLVFLDGVVINPWDDGNPPSIRFYPTQVAYSTSVFDPLMFWIIKIAHYLNPDDMGAADAFQSQVDQQKEQLQGMVDVMDSVQKPALDSVQSDLGAYVPQGDMVLATAPLGTLLNNEIIVTIFSISLLFVMASYVLFGKKG